MYAWIIPSAAIAPAFFAALARPFFWMISAAFSASPPASTSAFLQSIIPAPVRSRSSLTIAALISGIAFTLTAPALAVAGPGLGRDCARRAAGRRTLGRRAATTAAATTAAATTATATRAAATAARELDRHARAALGLRAAALRLAAEAGLRVLAPALRSLDRRIGDA